jgi:hypothetical protein
VRAPFFSPAVTVLLAGSSLAPVAVADVHATAPAGGGLAPLDVRVDLGRAVVEANGTTIRIELDRGELPSEAAVVVDVIAIGRGEHVVHVRVPAQGAAPEGRAWEAILASGRAQPLWAGVTGLSAGDPGERTGSAIRIVADGAVKYVIVGEVHEDNRICGQATTLLDPRALYPGSLEFEPATVHRLGADQRAAAEPIDARPTGAPLEAALAKLLVARSSSVPGSRGAELTDGDPQTVWQEQRPGIGQGEFVVLAAPRVVPIVRLQVVLSPPTVAGLNQGVSPKTFYLVTDAEAFRIAVPEDAWSHPGDPFEVRFPEPIETSCMALVLDDAYARGLLHPDVTVAEVVAYTPFDTPGATLGGLAKRLSSEAGVAVAQILERAGAASLDAVARAYDGLDARGRALAIDVAASQEPCASAAPLLARALCGDSKEAARKAREKLQRCSGAGPALASRLREDAASRACVAPWLAAIAPTEALEPIADAIAEAPEGQSASRATLRMAFGDALRRLPPDRLAPLLADRGRSATARLEMMRAAGERVVDARTESEVTTTELLTGASTMRVRYLVLGPLGRLARAGDELAATRIVNALLHDPDWPVRAAAAEAASELPAARVALIEAVADREPRVREAALASLVDGPSGDAVGPAIDRMLYDPWSFVRVKAVEVLAGAPAASRVDDALGAALRDASPGVRVAVIPALVRRHATSWRGAVRMRLDDKDEDHDVRASAAAALGALCDVDSSARLAELAGRLAEPGIDPDAEELGLGALAGLAALQPADLRTRLAPLVAPGSPPFARAAAQRALTVRSSCR